MHARFSDAMSNWTNGARVSPIFPVNGSPASLPSNGKTYYIVFWGPVHPRSLLEMPNGSRYYISIGFLNLIGVSDTQEEADALLRRIRDQCSHWESWKVAGDQIKVECSADCRQTQRPPPKFLTPLHHLSKAMQFKAMHFDSCEYVALAATVATELPDLLPGAGDEFDLYDAELRRVLATETLHPTARHGFLLNTNAVLSRYLQQIRCGAPPILASEFPSSAHSLLGIGLGVMALRRLRDSITPVLERADIVERVKRLEKQSPHPTFPLFLREDDPFWGEDLDEMPAQPSAGSSTDGDPSDDSRPVPLLVAYSGRDGFRNLGALLTAPLEMLTGGNTPQWTPLTLTHEICHTVVEDLLAVLIPRPGDRKSFDEAIRVMASENPAPNAMVQVRAMILYAYHYLHADRVSRVTYESLSRATVANAHEVNEILTHCLDFMLFYRRDPNAYLRSLWLSWDAVPNIHARLPDYVSRSLCALHVPNMARSGGADSEGSDSLDTTIDQFAESMNAIYTDSPDSQYVSRALELVRSGREQLRFNLGSRLPLVCMARWLFRSPAAAKLVESDPVSVDPERGTRPCFFPSTAIKNPLALVGANCWDGAGSAQRSAWLLTQLAFAESP